LGLEIETSKEPAYPERYKFLAVHAYERGELSEKELANYLQCDVWSVRQVVKDSLHSVELDDDGSSHSMQADFETFLLADNN